MRAPFTPEQESRVIEIARKEAIRAALAVAKLQAQRASAEAIDRFRVFEKELEEAVSSGVVEGPEIKC